MSADVAEASVIFCAGAIALAPTVIYDRKRLEAIVCMHWHCRVNYRRDTVSRITGVVLNAAHDQLVL